MTTTRRSFLSMLGLAPVAAAVASAPAASAARLSVGGLVTPGVLGPYVGEFGPEAIFPRNPCVEQFLPVRSLSSVCFRADRFVVAGGRAHVVSSVICVDRAELAEPEPWDGVPCA